MHRAICFTYVKNCVFLLLWVCRVLNPPGRLYQMRNGNEKLWNWQKGNKWKMKWEKSPAKVVHTDKFKEGTIDETLKKWMLDWRFKKKHQIEFCHLPCRYLLTYHTNLLTILLLTMLIPSHAFIAVKLDTTGRFDRNLNKTNQNKYCQNSSKIKYANFRWLFWQCPNKRSHNLNGSSLSGSSIDFCCYWTVVRFQYFPFLDINIYMLLYFNISLF